jgi:hypothetical protein
MKMGEKTEMERVMLVIIRRIQQIADGTKLLEPGRDFCAIAKEHDEALGQIVDILRAFDHDYPYAVLEDGEDDL